MAYYQTPAWANTDQPPLDATTHIIPTNAQIQELARLDSLLLNTLNRLHDHIATIPEAPRERITNVVQDTRGVLVHAQNQVYDMTRKLHRMFRYHPYFDVTDIMNSSRSLSETNPEYNTSPHSPPAVPQSHYAQAPSRTVTWDRIMGHGAGFFHWPESPSLAWTPSPARPTPSPRGPPRVSPSPPTLGPPPVGRGRGKGKKRSYDEDEEDAEAYTPSAKRARLDQSTEDVVIREQAAAHEVAGNWVASMSYGGPCYGTRYYSGTETASASTSELTTYRLVSPGPDVDSTYHERRSCPTYDDYPDLPRTVPNTPAPNPSSPTYSPPSPVFNKDSPRYAPSPPRHAPTLSCYDPTTLPRRPYPSTLPPRFTFPSPTGAPAPAPNPYLPAAEQTIIEYGTPIPPAWSPTVPYAEVAAAQKVKREPSAELVVAGPSKEIPAPRRSQRTRRPAKPRSSYGA
ncbi:unnamed protein product [Peniophora sp. CBMAI 1063]|nr:unnamed protein product [Peniophora sp. CBMAI 1063]